MAWIQSRIDRLRQLVATCIKAGRLPGQRRAGLADFVLNAAATLGLTPQTCRAYLRTLIHAWNHDRWRSYVENNPYLTEEQRETFLEQQTQPDPTQRTYRRADQQ